MELADGAGIDAVSMRNLAKVLGVVPMALYKHVSGKEDLLAGMIDVIVEMYDPPAVGRDWKDAIRRRILSARRVLLQHPWAREAIQSRTQRTPAVLAYMDSLAGMFMKAGFSADLTHHAMHALGYRIWGFSPEAFTGPNALPIPKDAAAQTEMMRRMTAAYPHIVAIAADASGGDSIAAIKGCDEEFEFEFALDLLLDAFERLHQAGWTSRGRKKRSR
ncbi:TetR/AcrR family transcriptional regulator [Hoyosella sp. YIM 151337]|uniref:TetR/AcrR family transcriptional regulator n=1 Tax=Hoyosella sp. YIM 151337 TaxID=2992742 RepID=UPI0022366B52|nr:TetR/AcrR family transcriptional regulator [Hoyosella sp. YIM 151337]MCW4353036.1 TetR/AcrR family transcriptional regulator [Hoyosella sp. YIM 151337]